ncbi:MAG: NRPS [Chrysothrix sp. TS-e1954]|nr:MAG: NRPS [Chrysothrix sp. TS-e1954]
MSRTSTSDIMLSDDVDEKALSEISEACHVSLGQIEDTYPCTALQLGTMAESIKQDGAYMCQLIFSLSSSVDFDLLSTALQQVVSQNAILRTRLVECGSRLVQVVVREDVCTERLSQGIDTYLANEQTRSIQLGSPLLRSVIVDQKWVLSTHHAIADQWCHLELLADVWRVYQGQNPKDHAAFKSFVEYCHGIDLPAAKSFWASRYHGSPAIFPTVERNHVPKASHTLRKQIELKELGASISPALLPSYIEAAWALTAHVFTDSDSITYGLVLSGRTNALAGIETTLGPTITTIPVQVDLQPNMTVEDLLKERSRQRRQAQSHPTLQYGTLNIRTLNPAARIASEFQTVLNIGRKEDGSRSDLWALDYADEGFGSHSLTLSFLLKSNSVVVEARFDKRVLCMRQMQRSLQQFEHALQRLIEVPRQTKLDQLPLLNEYDFRDILKWNDSIPNAVDECLHSLFTAQAQKHCATTAVDAPDGSFSYAELDERSNRLAHELRRRNVSVESPVPLIFDKSRWAIVAILAIMKAGAACVPLNPASPHTRQQAIISICKAQTVLVSSAFHREFADLAPDVYLVDSTTIETLPDMGSIGATSLADQAAYIIFTSGSSGAPKGVVLEHRCLATSISSIATRLGYQRDFGVLQFSAFMWDACILDIFMPLLLGGRVCMPSEEARQSSLPSYIESKKVDWAFLTPTVLRMLSPNEVPGLKTVLSIGEVVDANAYETWGGVLRMFNCYGPTEISLICTLAQLSPPSLYPQTIGTSVGSATWITDSKRSDKLAPIGAVGELVIEGPGVARGYLDDKVKTNASFIQPPPWAPARGSKPRFCRRFYRTGDLVKYNADGTICFVGRMDGQVKLHGQRLELSEVESAISSCAGVRDVFVTMQGSQNSDKRLTSVLSLADPRFPGSVVLKNLTQGFRESLTQTFSSICSHLEDRLPPYMIPKIWFAVEQLPRTTSLKMDRVAITKWLDEETLSSEGAGHIIGKNRPCVTAPESNEEMLLQSVWSSVLAVPEQEIGRESSFVGLGGDSVTAMQVANRCRRRGANVTVTALLRGPDLAIAAAECRTLSKTPGTQLENRARENIWHALLPIQSYLASCSGLAAQSSFNQSLLLELHSETPSSSLQNALQKLVFHHPMLRARFLQRDAGQWAQMISSKTESAWRFRVHSAGSKAQVHKIVNETWTSLDITSGPLFATDLINMQGPSNMRLLSLVANHLVIDMGSWRVLLEDLERLLHSPQHLLAEEAQFPSQVGPQAKAANDSPVDRHPKTDLRFWGLSDTHTLSARMVRRGFDLDTEASNAIMGACNVAFNTTPSELMLAGVLASFHKVFPDRGSPALHCEIDGRQSDKLSVDLSRTVGCLSTLVPLQVPVDSMTQMYDTLVEVKDCYRELSSNTQAFVESPLSGTDSLQTSKIELMFNFLDRPQRADGECALLKLASLDLVQAQNIGDNVQQLGLLSVQAAALNERLRFSVDYDDRVAHQDRLERWVAELERTLRIYALELPTKEIQLTLTDVRLITTCRKSLSGIHLGLETLGIPPSNVETIYPCTPLQEGILFTQSKSDRDDYWQRFMFKITPRDFSQRIDILKLIDAWSAVVKANHILRTVFASGLGVESAFQQIVLKATDPWIEQAVAQTGLDSQSLLRGYSRPSFKGWQPPNRLMLLEESSSAIWIMLDISHAATDGQGVRIALEQLGRAYSNETSMIHGLKFAEYVTWVQRHQDKTRDYWDSRLFGAMPCLIPISHDSKQAHKSDPGELRVRVPFHDVDKLLSFGKQHNATIADMIQVSWSIVLRLYTGRASIFFGYLFSGRNAFEGAETLLGPLATMLVSKFNVKLDTNALSLLKIAKEDSAEAFEHPAYSLSQIQDSLGLSDSPLFNTALTIQPAWPEDLAVEGAIKIKSMEIIGGSEYPIVVSVSYSKEIFECLLSYRPSLVSEPFISQVAETFAAVIDNIVKDSEQSISALTSPIERWIEAPTRFTLITPGIRDQVKRRAARQCQVSKTMIEDIFPCSPLQQTLIDRSNAGVEAYVALRVFKINTEQAINEVCEAWNTVRSSIPALRTRIVSLDEYGVYQVVVKPNPIWTEEEDLNEYLKWDQDLDVQYGGPLCRFGRVEEANGDCYVIVSLHKAVCDAQAFHIVSESLESVLNGDHLPKMPSLSGFIHHLIGRNLINSQSNHWKGRPGNLSDGSSLPDLSVAALQQTYHDSKSSLTVVTPGGRDDSSVSAILQAAWALCISRTTGNSKVTFDIIVSGYDAPIEEITNTVGPLGVAAPVLVEVTRNSACGAFVEDVQALVSETAHWAHAIPEVGVLSNTLAIQSAARGPGKSETASSAYAEVPVAQSRLTDAALATTCRVSSDKTEIEMAFDSRLLSSARIDIILHQFEHAINQLSSMATRKLSDLELLSAHEISQLRVWNERSPNTVTACIHDQIREVSIRSPHSPAVYSWDDSLDYGQLDDLSDRLAVRLREAGVRAEKIVPFFCEKSAIAPVIVLAILKAGGAILALDARHPIKRLASILHEVDPVVILSTVTLSERVKSFASGVTALDLSYIRSLSSLKGPEGVIVEPSNACYVIYTSGSTGKPKGVVVNHSNIATSFAGQRLKLGVNTETRVLQLANLVFDAALADIFLTFLSGGCLCIPSEKEWVEDLAAVINRTRSNYMMATPTVASILSPPDVPSLEKLILVGEPMQRAIFEVWARDRCLINAYGPSETASLSSSRILRCDSKTFANIGHPTGCRYWVVDVTDHHNLVPLGCPGELLIQGPIVSRGYLQNADLTNAAFIACPAWTSQFKTLYQPPPFYKTGDLVTQEPDGSIIYQGRKDSQVKLRGLRIEVGEVEYHLGRNAEPTWRLAVELIRPVGQEQDGCLAAFFTESTLNEALDLTRSDSLHEGLLPPLSEKSSALAVAVAADIPEFMIPQIYVRLSRLPLTSSGKVDRKTLRAIGSSMTPANLRAYSVSMTSQDEPTTASPELDGGKPVEINKNALKRAWSSVLSIPQNDLSSTANFFTCGGNSIRAIRMISAARKEGLSLTVTNVFKYPSLEAMAATASSVQNTPTDVQPNRDSDRPLRTSIGRSGACVLPPTLTTQEIPFLRSENIERLTLATDPQAMMIAVGDLGSSGFRNTFYIKASSGLDTSRLQIACQDIIKRHPILRTVFVQQDASLLQVVLKHAPAPQVHVNGEDDAVQTMPGTSPLPQFYLSSHAERCDCLRLEIHHALYDAMSMMVLFQDLEAAYAGGVLSTAPSFHEWTSHTLAMDFDAAQSYWRGLLQTSPMTSLTPSSLSNCYHPLDASSCLQVPFQRAYLPPGTAANAVKAAWSLVLARAFDTKDVVFGEINSNRNSSLPGVDEVCGPCLAILPVKAHLDRGTTFASLTMQLQDQSIANIPYQHLGLRSIIKDCSDWPSWTRFGSLLTFQNHESLSSFINIGETRCEISAKARTGELTDIWVLATPRTESLDIELLYSKERFSCEQVDWISKCFVAILTEIPAWLEQSTDVCNDESLQSIGSYPTTPDSLVPSSDPLDRNSKDPTQDALDTVERAWKDVKLFTKDQSKDSEMWNFGADLVTCLLLSDYYQYGGYTVSTKDIEIRPSRRAQAKLLDEVRVQ